MLTDQGRLIVDDSLCAHCSVHTKQVHDREFPEIRAECGSIAEAVSHLIGRLRCARKNIQSNWHRGLIDQAIADATAFLHTMVDTGRNQYALCQCAAHVPEPIGSSLP